MSKERVSVMVTCEFTEFEGDLLKTINEVDPCGCTFSVLSKKIKRCSVKGKEEKTISVPNHKHRSLGDPPSPFTSELEPFSNTIFTGILEEVIQTYSYVVCPVCLYKVVLHSKNRTTGNLQKQEKQ
jgi:DNA-directed RNA polymerase subunit RPC12/RpoP